MSDTLDVRRAGGILRRRFWTIVASTIAVVVAVVAMTRVWPKTYRSYATLLVENPAQGQGRELPALAALEKLGKASTMATEIELVRSRRVLEAVADSLDLHVVVRTSGGVRRPSEVFPAFRASSSSDTGVVRVTATRADEYVIADAATGAVLQRAKPSESVTVRGMTFTLPREPVNAELTVETTTLEAAVSRVQRRLDVSLLHRDADILKVGCDGPSPLAAWQLCHAVTETYVRFRGELQRTDATGTANFLREQVARLGAHLRVAEESLQTFRSREHVVALDDQATEEVRQYAKVKAHRDELEAEHSALTRMMRSIKQAGQGQQSYRDLALFPVFAQNAAVSGLVANLVQLENRRSDLTLRRGDQNAEVKAVNERLAATEDELLAVATSYEGALTDQIRSLEETLARSEGRLAEIPIQQIAATRLERQVSVLGDLNRQLEMRLREAEVAEGVHPPNVSVVDNASLPATASTPNARLNVALGILVGLVFGTLLGLVRESLDHRIHERRDAEAETGMPILGLIPTVKKAGPVLAFSLDRVTPVVTQAVGTPLRTTSGATQQMAAPRRWLAWNRRGNGGRPSAPNGHLNVSLEAFRSLNADLSFVGRQLEHGALRCVAVTSSVQGEGKTYTACNLALARASQGARVLLIDADLRSGRVGRFFGLASHHLGLRQVLRGEVAAHDVWLPLYVVGSGPMWILAAGSPTPHAAELLSAGALSELIRQARDQFDLVVIDTPPLNVITDAAVIAEYVDALLLVVRLGRGSHEALALTMQRLERVGSQVLGVVLNGANLPAEYARYDYHHAATSRR